MNREQHLENRTNCINKIKEKFPHLGSVGIHKDNIPGCYSFFLGASEYGEHPVDWWPTVKESKEINALLEEYGYFWEINESGGLEAIYDDLATMNIPIWCLNIIEKHDAVGTIVYDNGCPF